MKKTLTKIISVMLIVCITLTSAPLSGLVGLQLPEWLDFSIKSSAAETSGTCGENLTWTYDSSTYTLTISGTGDMKNYSTDYMGTTTNRPWEYYCEEVQNVVISNGVTSIGNYAFRKFSSITNITIPSSVTSIGIYAFYGCHSLSNITIPDNVTTIAEGVFYYCTSLTKIIIPDSITSIGESSFRCCTSIKNVTISDNVSSIGDLAFFCCSNLKDIYYSGTEEQWSAISIGSDNEPLLNTTIHFNSTGPDSGDSELPVHPDSTVVGTFKSQVLVVSNSSWTSEITVDENQYILNSDYAQEIDLTNNEDDYKNKKVIFIIKNNEVVFLDTVDNINSGNSTLTAVLDTGLYAVPIQYTNGKFTSKKVNVSGFIKNALSRSDVDVSVLSSLGSFELENIKVTLESSDKNILYFKKNVLSTKSNSITFDYNSTITPGTYEPFIQQAYLNTRWEFPEGSKNHSIDITCTVTGTINGKTVSDSFKNTITFINSDYTTPKVWKTQSLTDLIKEMQNEVQKSDLSEGEKLEVELILISILQSQQLTDLDADLDAFNTVYKLGCYAYGIKNPSIADAGEKMLDLIVAKCDQATSDLKNDMEELFQSLCNSPTFNKFAWNYYNKYQVQIGNMKQINAHCPIDISVVDEDGLQVLSIVNDEIVLTDEGVVAFVCDGKKTIYLPTDIDHIITITATGTGTMDYSVTERNSDNELRTVEYSDITLTNGKKFTGEVSKELLPSADEYNLSANTGEKIEYDSVSVEDADTELEVVLSNISVYSNPTKITYSLGESLNTSGLKLKIMYSDGSTEIVSTGYTVSGFDSTTAGVKTVTVSYGGKSTTFTVTVTKPTTYTLSYDANGGSGAPSSQTKTHGITLTLSNTKPTRTGYTFLGWSTSSTATSATYQPGGSFTTNANTTLYAVWHKHSYTSQVTKAPTCTATGIKIYTCIQCNESYDEIISALGHNYILRDLIPATNTTNGSRIYTCSRCSNTHSETIPKEYADALSIQTPSRTEIRNKDGIILHANVEGNAPVGSYVEWTASNGNFKTEQINNGNSLKIISDSNGYTTFTATLYSAEGKFLTRDTIEMKSKAGLFDKIGGFFRSLFGSTKIYEN